MSISPGISVEVFRDRDARNLSTESAEAGVDIVRQITTGIEIIRTTGLITIANPKGDDFDMEKIRWPRFEADLNIVVTNRPLYDPDRDKNTTATANVLTGRKTTLVGNSLYVPGVGTGRVAVIDTSRSGSPVHVAAHETGHLLKLKSSGDSWNFKGHCIDPECLMQSGEKLETVTEYKPLSSLKAWLGCKPERTVTYKSLVEDFCDECTEQLDRNAHYYQLAKAGEMVPLDLY